jgi:2-iminobutanoate/2-iminopropanoate deaminase
MKKISTSNAPEAAGHYSQAIVANGFIFVSGQLPLDPITRKVVEGGIDDQVRQTMANVRNILVAAGADLEDIVKVNISIVDGDLWGEVNRVFAEVMGEHKPARAVIPCGPLHYGALCEIEVIAKAG